MLFPTYGVPMQIHAADGKFASSPIVGNVHELVEFYELPICSSSESIANANGDSSWTAPRLPR
jgi:hypothetical protein